MRRITENNKAFDYKHWAEDYSREAQRLKELSTKMKSGCHSMTREERMVALSQSNMLYTMYLECRHTAKLLDSRAREALSQ